MKRDTRAAYRRRAADTERMVDEAVAHVKAIQRAEWEAAKERGKADAALAGRYTAADLKDARMIRDGIGWHVVVRVNAKSVTVKTPWSWTNRIAIKQVREWR